MNSAIGFPMPKSIVIDDATKTDTYAKFTAQPFQAGFGHTLGNSLRISVCFSRIINDD